MSTLTTQQTEAQFQQAVIELARLQGWLAYHTHNSRHSAAGFPDLALVHRGQRRLIFAELKTEKGRVSEAQEEWLDALDDIFPPSAENDDENRYGVYLWRPRDWPEIERVLGRRAA